MSQRARPTRRALYLYPGCRTPARLAVKALDPLDGHDELNNDDDYLPVHDDDHHVFLDLADKAGDPVAVD